MSENPDRSYGWYKAHCFNDYMERIIGEYGEELEQMGFNDESSNTDYLDCVKFCADLVWHEYQVKQEEAHPRPDTALVNTDVLDTVLLSLHPAEVVAANEEVSQRSKEGLAQLHRFYALIKLEKVEEEEMEALLENLPDEYAAMLALMCWFVTLASKMTGTEIPGVGMAPGGKIVKPEQEVKEHLSNMLAVAEAMSASMHWNFLAQYSILKEMLADLRIIANTWDKQTAGSATEPMKKEMKEQVEQAESKDDEKEEVKDVGSEEEEEKPDWIRSMEEFVAGLWWWQEEEEEEEKTNASSTVEPAPQRSAGAGAAAPAHREAQPGDVGEQLEQFEKQLEQLEERMEEHVHDAAAHEEEEVKETDGGQASAAMQEGQEEVETEQIDPRVVQQVHHAYRLGGHGAAAMALWWLEEGSTNGYHFDQAALHFTELPSEVKERFLWRAILLMANHPLEEEEDGVGRSSQK